MRGETILIVDDEKLIRWSLQQELTKAGFSVLSAETTKQGLSLLKEREPDLMILDQLLPDGTGIDVLREIKSSGVVLPVIMLTAIDRSDIAVQAMKLGAVDYVTKPVNIDELKIVIERELEATRLKRQMAHFLRQQEKSYGFCGMIGSSPQMQKVFDTITRIAQSSGTTVLITGESGTGKELAAKAIHFLGARRDNPLITVNFSAMAETIIESELFGHEKGAFTDARNQKKGVFELAHKGTIFLDEIGDVSLKVQVKLLRVLEQKSFQRVGGTSDITVDVRIIAATNRSLESRLAEEKFRADLYYRLNVASVHLPPLRERGEDIVLLAEYFLQEFNTKFHKEFKRLAEETKELFSGYHWPGNVREMRNVLERAILLWDDDVIQPHHIEFPRLHQPPPPSFDPGLGAAAGNVSLYELEKQALIQALTKTNQNQSRAAKLLKISRDTLRYKMKKYGLLT
ncbi:MAG: sigma-54 dependent transcriptional regulator [Bacteroidota bacterium]|jgi:DNA-binding NtrC family response regulator